MLLIARPKLLLLFLVVLQDVSLLCCCLLRITVNTLLLSLALVLARYMLPELLTVHAGHSHMVSGKALMLSLNIITVLN